MPETGAPPDVAAYNAAICQERAGDVGLAIAGFEALRKAHPKSPVAARALGRVAVLHARIAEYREAAIAFEEYAKKYPAEKDTYAAMNDAVFYRKSIGDDDQAIADTKAFIKLFGAKKPSDAAHAFFSLASIYEERNDAKALLAHYNAYLKTYGATGGADKLVFAYTRIGELLWEQSCPVKPVDGACVKVKAAAPRVKRCGPAIRPTVTVVPRDPRKLKEAMAAFSAAARAYEVAGGKFPGGDGYSARRYYASARFHQGELDFEAFLAIEFPAGLDFDPAKPAERKKSTERFEAWFKASDHAAGAATAKYMSLITDVKDPGRAIAASARIGQISNGFVDAVLTSPVPKFIAGDADATAAYCSKLTEVAEPFEAKAVEAYGVCLKTSTDVGWWSSWSRLCEIELGRLRPDAYPAAHERWAHPDVSVGVTALEGP